MIGVGEYYVLRDGKQAERSNRRMKMGLDKNMLLAFIAVNP